MFYFTLVKTFFHFFTTESIPEGLEPPTFVKELQEATIVEGSSLKLKCKVKGEPKPEIEW